MQKKKILIAINSLHVGGAEKSLVSFLNELDYTKYEVDLQMFNLEGDFLCLLNGNVGVLDKLDFINFCNQTFIKQLFSFKYKYLISRMKLSLDLRIKFNDKLHDSQIYWKNCSNCFENNSTKYDVALGWGQGLPTYYVIEKVNAIKKFALVNVNYELAGYNSLFDIEYYSCLNNIIIVSNELMRIFKNSFPSLVEKMKVIYDINSYKTIKKLSEEKLIVDYNDEITNIITVGRMSKQKGYDLAVETAKVLMDKGLQFKWYFIGDGPERENLEKLINKYELRKYVVLEGLQKNPYKYINNADIYVQTSRFEGYCLTLAESRMLNKPIVTTNFDVVHDQMKNEINGLIVDMNPVDIAKAIIRLLNDNELRNHLITNLKKEKKGNEEEIIKFYKLFDS